MAEKQPTKKTGSGSKPRSKAKEKQSEAAVPPKVVSAIGQGDFLVREAPFKYHELKSIETHKFTIKKPSSTNAESQTYVTGSKHGAVVHSSVPGKVEPKQSGPSTPTSN